MILIYPKDHTEIFFRNSSFHTSDNVVILQSYFSTIKNSQADAAFHL